MFNLITVLHAVETGLEIAGCQWPKAGHILKRAGENKFELPSEKKWQVKFYRTISFICLPQLIYTISFSRLNTFIFEM
jgi:hypothetical protein